MSEMISIQNTGFLKAVVNRCEEGSSFTVEIFHVVKNWMPISLAGTSVSTQVITVPVESSSISTWNLLNREDGLFIVAVNQPDVRILSNEFSYHLREDVKRQLIFAWVGQKGFIEALSKSVFKLGFISILLMCAVAYMLAPKDKLNSVDYSRLPITPISTLPENAPSEVSAEDLRLLSSSSVAQERSAKEGVISPTEAITKAAKILLTQDAKKAAKQMYVWADPFCSNCRAIEPLLESLDADIGVNIIPVAFKEGSRVLVSYMFCGSGSSDQTSRWNGMMQDKPVGKIDQQCDSGPGTADENSTLFLRAGLVSTPTIMKENGEIYQGELTKTAISSWLKAK